MRQVFTLLLVFVSFHSFSIRETMIAPPGKLPVEVAINMYFNKILNINTVDESYQIDGYLELSWIDESKKFETEDQFSRSLIYENDQAIELMNNELWFPTCEMKNVQGKREINNLNIEIRPNGRVIYTERFYGTFNSDMNFKKFPFDTQIFNVVIESFSYDKTIMTFTDPKLFPLIENSQTLFAKWVIDTLGTRMEDVKYEEFSSVGYQTNTYSRVVFEIEAKRLSGYFVWQVLFPLLIIIMASFLVFWIKDFSTQVGIGFTLMLTVVAFNFYSASILPQLPYNTFIETIIMTGYSFIFLTIIAVIVNNRVNEKREKEQEIHLLNYFRYVFPVFYFIVMFILSYQFYHN
jgi:hypothetical protein